jgi:hypothetical protein
MVSSITWIAVRGSGARPVTQQKFARIPVRIEDLRLTFLIPARSSLVYLG